MKPAFPTICLLMAVLVVLSVQAEPPDDPTPDVDEEVPAKVIPPPVPASLLRSKITLPKIKATKPDQIDSKAPKYHSKTINKPAKHLGNTRPS